MFRRRITSAGTAIATTGAARSFADEAAYLKARAELQDKVRATVFEGLDSTAFSKEHMNKCITEFFNLNIEWTYVRSFNHLEVLEHIIGYASAKAEVSRGLPFEYAFEDVREGAPLLKANPQLEGTFWWCENTPDAMNATQRRIEAYALRKGRRMGHSMRSYASEDVALWILEFEPFNKPFEKGQPYTTLENACTKSFVDERSPDSHARYDKILTRLSTSIIPVFEIRNVGDAVNITMGFNPDRSSYLTALTTLFGTIPGATVTKRFLETFNGGQQVYSFFIKGTTREEVEKVAHLIGMLPHRPDHAVTRMFEKAQITPEMVPFCHSLIIFAFYFTPPLSSPDYQSVKEAIKSDEKQLRKLDAMRQQMHQELMSENYVAAILEKHAEFVVDLYNKFKEDKIDYDLKCATVDTLTTSPSENAILRTFVRFVKSIKKTNYFKVGRAAVSYRLDPATFLGVLDYPAMPYGIFLVVGAQFRGFHVRFNDIARGGIRMIMSKGEKYRHNRLTLFQENFNLAYAQHKKNKDIPESGSKGTILVSDRRGPNPTVMYLQYIDSILDLLLEGESGVRNKMDKPEILFMGPDENTAGDLPSAAAFHAKSRGYAAWKSFTTGKGQDIGGVPHDIYGMTTESVRANVKAIYKQFNLDETTLTKFQTGGPDGDLGSNEIFLGKEKWQGLVDISGVLYDPEGVNHQELVRLANQRPNLKLRDFDKTKLGPKGFFVDANDKDVTLPDGTVVASGEAFRDGFHFSDYVKTDVFVPCGGRPNSVTLANVHKLLVNCPEFTGETMLYGKVGDLASAGKTRFKYIVEGANLFITPDARLALENVGVVVVKDSSANKGGVTSSSIEVLAALSLTDAEHAEHMCVKNNGKDFPKFYNQLVEEIIQRIRSNATREYEVISAEVSRGAEGGFRPKIADAISARIVKMRNSINDSALFEDEKLRRYVLELYVPKLIQELVGIDNVIKRVPENYLRACFATYIAYDYVYSTGLQATEFDFFQYMHRLYKNSGSKQ